jgi:hypothetical protein
MNLLTKSVLCTAILASGFAHAGEAPTVSRTTYFNAPAHCQGALPNFEGALRKRPLALQNEGTSSAFVTCAIPTQGRVSGLEVYVSTHNGTSSPVTCTAVTGWKGGTNHYVPKTVETDASGEWAVFFWAPGDFVPDATAFPNGYIALSCNLAPGTGLNDFWVYSSETVG